MWVCTSLDILIFQKLEAGRYVPGGRPITLTAKETALLEYLLIHPGETISQARLIEHIWGEETDEFSNSVRVHISTLRRKLRAALGRDPIRTHIGAGYCLEEE